MPPNKKIIEKYATRAQFAAVQAGSTGGEREPSLRWIVEGNEVRLNHAGGITTGNETQILQNYVHHNGQLGVQGYSENTLIEGNEIAFNNILWFSSGWAAGGSKFTSGSINLVLRNNHVHHNTGIGNG